MHFKRRLSIEKPFPSFCHLTKSSGPLMQRVIGIAELEQSLIRTWPIREAKVCLWSSSTSFKPGGVLLGGQLEPHENLLLT